MRFMTTGKMGGVLLLILSIERVYELFCEAENSFCLQESIAFAGTLFNVGKVRDVNLAKQL